MNELRDTGASNNFFSDLIVGVELNDYLKAECEAELDRGSEFTN